MCPLQDGEEWRQKSQKADNEKECQWSEVRIHAEAGGWKEVIRVKRLQIIMLRNHITHKWK